MRYICSVVSSVHRPCRTMSSEALIDGIFDVNGDAIDASPSLTIGVSIPSIASSIIAAFRAALFSKESPPPASCFCAAISDAANSFVSFIVSITVPPRSFSACILALYSSWRFAAAALRSLVFFARRAARFCCGVCGSGSAVPSATDFRIACARGVSAQCTRQAGARISFART